MKQLRENDYQQQHLIESLLLLQQIDRTDEKLMKKTKTNQNDSLKKENICG